MVSNFYPPWRGGVETYVSNIAKRLVRRGHCVTVLCSSDPVSPGREIIEDVSVTRLRSLFKIYGTPIAPGLAVKLARLTCDIVHANFPSPFAAFASSLFSRVRKVPSVLTWHNDLPPVKLGARLLIQAHDALVLPTYLEHFDRVIATSHEYFRISEILKGVGKKVVIIPNGVDCQVFNESIDGQEIRSLYGLEDCFVVLFVGALTKWHGYKGLDVLLRAFSTVRRQEPKARLLVVGAGHLLEHYKSMARGLNLGDSVVFAGEVSNEKLPAFFACADVFVLPSKDKSEGFGLTLLEANACGKPVIGSRVGGVPAVVREGFNGLLVPPNDASSLAEGILLLLWNEELRSQIGKNGRSWAEQHDWNIVTDRVEQLYYEVLKNA